MSDSNQRHPDSTFRAEYPYNQATISRAGHEIHINDTPGSESLRVSHTKGTYVEIESTGRWVQTIVEKAYTYIKDAYALTVDSHMDTKVAGTHTLNVDQSAWEAIGQDKTVGVGGDLIDGVGGVRQVHTEKDKMESVNGSYTIAVKGDVNTYIEGDAITDFVGSRGDIIAGDWSVTCGSSIDTNSTNVIRFKCKNFIIEADSITFQAIAGAITMSATQGISMTASGGNITQTAAAGNIGLNAAGGITGNAQGSGGMTLVSGGAIDVQATGNVDIQSGGVINLNE